jgi:hypothetical protein
VRSVTPDHLGNDEKLGTTGLFHVQKLLLLMFFFALDEPAHAVCIYGTLKQKIGSPTLASLPGLPQFSAVPGPLRSGLGNFW